MDKEIVSLMCKKIQRQHVDIDRMVIENPKLAIDYIHGQYRAAVKSHHRKSQS